MKEYTFDCKLFATFTMQANDVEEARRLVIEQLDCSTAIIGGHDVEVCLDGDPVLAEDL